MSELQGLTNAEAHAAVSRYEFERIQLDSVEAYNKVDAMLADGWTAVPGSGLFSILLQRKRTK